MSNNDSSHTYPACCVLTIFMNYYKHIVNSKLRYGAEGVNMWEGGGVVNNKQDEMHLARRRGKGFGCGCRDVVLEGMGQVVSIREIEVFCQINKLEQTKISGEGKKQVRSRN
jgi:hypothetical protein